MVTPFPSKTKLADIIPWALTLFSLAAIGRHLCMGAGGPRLAPPAAAAARHPSVASWFSPRCQAFYKESLKSGVTPVAEDMFYAGRQFAMAFNHHANEVTVSHKYRFIYVEVRKAASSTIRTVLAKHFNAT